MFCDCKKVKDEIVWEMMCERRASCGFIMG